MSEDEWPCIAGNLEEKLNEKFWKTQGQIIVMNERFVSFCGWNVGVIIL